MAKSSKRRPEKIDKRSRRRSEAKEAVRQTKKQIAFGRRQARQTRLIWLSVGGLGVIILAVLAVGLIQEFVLRPGGAVASVNGDKIPVDDFQALLAYRRYNLHLDINNLQSNLQTMDPSDETNQLLISFYQQQLEQLQGALTTVADTTLEELIDDELIQQKAEELEITVTADEVQETITEDIQQAVTLSSQQALTDTEQIETPTPVPQDLLDEFYQSAIDNMGLSNKEFRAIVGRSLLRGKVQENLASQVPTTGLVVHVQMIQVDSEEEATAARQRVDSGEDLSTVATEVSTLSQAEENGGDMGWVTPGQLAASYGEELDAYIFSIATGEIGQVQSNEQYYVVKILERDENGPLPETVLTSRQNSALQDWLTEERDSPEVLIERLLKPEHIPADPYA